VQDALHAWASHDVAEAERILVEMEVPFQHTWETCYVRGLCRRKAFPLIGHAGGVSCVAYSRDGKRIASVVLPPQPPTGVYAADYLPCILAESYLKERGLAKTTGFSLPIGENLPPAAQGDTICRRPRSAG
jgi:hypothetical protein